MSDREFFNLVFAMFFPFMIFTFVFGLFQEMNMGGGFVPAL